MIIFFDSETTGLPVGNAPSADPRQPHLVQLGMILTNDDGAEVSRRSVIIRPDGWTIPPAMTAIHGISHERAMDEGIPEAQAAALFVVTQARARLRVAHNESFDRRILGVAMIRAGFERYFIDAIEARNSFCTCKAAKPVMKMPPTERITAALRPGFKEPKLSECIQHFFKEELTGAHEAMADAEACMRVYFHLRALEGVTA